MYTLECVFFVRSNYQVHIVPNTATRTNEYISSVGGGSLRIELYSTVNILKFGTPQTIAIIVLRIEKFDETLH